MNGAPGLTTRSKDVTNAAPEECWTQGSQAWLEHSRMTRGDQRTAGGHQEEKRRTQGSKTWLEDSMRKAGGQQEETRRTRGHRVRERG